MLIRGIVWTLGVILGVVAVVSTKEYIDLATGNRILDFIPLETSAQAQRQHTAGMRMVAIGSTVGCLASFMFAFYRRAR
jgi:hypothetical protein